jgi:thiol-disulfide isomerase/thioredoxin
MTFGKVVIRGKIIGYDGTSVVYYHPTLEGVFSPYWKEVQPSITGTFKIEYENEGYGNATITYKRMQYRFFHDGDSQIYVELRDLAPGSDVKSLMRLAMADSAKKAQTITISGDYEAINRYYNRNLRTSYYTTRSVGGNYYSQLIYKASTPQRAMYLLDSLTEYEVRQIDKLPLTLSKEYRQPGGNDKHIREYLINEVHSFYSAVLLNALFRKRYDQAMALLKDSTTRVSVYNREWELLVEEVYKHRGLTLPPIPSSPDYQDFIQALTYGMSSYRQYSFPQSPTVTPDRMMQERLFGYDTLLIADKKMRLAYELLGLQLYLNDQLFYSPALLHAVYQLQQKYPDSQHLHFYNPLIEKLKASLDAAKNEFREAEFIVGRYDSFNALISRFRGNNLLIDIWATWCHPCIQDFKDKDVLQPLTDSGRLKVLYISIDKREWEDRWNQSVRINKLAGSHYRATSRFIADMWEAIGGLQGAIPRYVLINREGNLFMSTAAKPGAELVAQVEKLIMDQ